MDTFPIVAVASSAGDIAAVSELLSALPAECSAAFLIVQAVDSSREQLLLEAIAASTTLAVTRAHDGALVEPGHVYVITTKITLTMSGGQARLTSGPSALHHLADMLFTSLAKERGASAIGVVLSGEGADGACGIQAIRQAGGATLAQHPGSARFPSMPINAIQTGCVDRVLRPNEIARELTFRGRATAPAADVARDAIVTEGHAGFASGRLTVAQPSIAS